MHVLWLPSGTFDVLNLLCIVVVGVVTFLSSVLFVGVVPMINVDSVRFYVASWLVVVVL